MGGAPLKRLSTRTWSCALIVPTHDARGGDSRHATGVRGRVAAVQTTSAPAGQRTKRKRQKKGQGRWGVGAHVIYGKCGAKESWRPCNICYTISCAKNVGIRYNSMMQYVAQMRRLSSGCSYYTHRSTVFIFKFVTAKTSLVYYN